MAVTKSNYVAVLNGEDYKLDCAPFPRSESKLVEKLTVNGEAVLSAVSRSKAEVYYTYFMWEGKSYSFQRGLLIEAPAEITLRPVAGKPVAAPKVEKSLKEELAESGVSVEAALKAAAYLDSVAPKVEKPVAAPKVEKPKRARKPKGE
jgi:hypothetical protein